MHPLESLEQRRQRGLHAVRELQAVAVQRPLLDFEQRAMRRNQGLVDDMNRQIRALLGAPDPRPDGQARSRP